MKFELARHRIDKIPRDRLLEELARAASANGYVEFGKRDFTRLSTISATTVTNTFGKWSRTMGELRTHLDATGKQLKPKRRVKYADYELFEEMQRIWSILGHRPSRIEWESHRPRISYGTYKHRFNGWTNACLAFIEWLQGNSVAEDDGDAASIQAGALPQAKAAEVLRKRTIPLAIRLKVLKRDNFKCVYCGRSPATNVGVELHLDHIVPFSQGGETEEGNLQTLCMECNVGKGKQVDA